MNDKRNNSLIVKSMGYQDCQDLISALTSISCVTLGKLLNCAVPPVLSLKVGRWTVFTVFTNSIRALFVNKFMSVT